MTDEGGLAINWVPNERFQSEARRFAEYRLTDRYRADEVEYKAGLAALIRALASQEVFEAEGVGQLAALIDGHLDLESVVLDEPTRAVLARWPYHQSLLNLLGGGQAAVIQASTLKRWALSDPETVAAEIEQLLRGPEPLAERVDRFIAAAQAAYGHLFAEGRLRAREVPRVSATGCRDLVVLDGPHGARPFPPGRLPTLGGVV